MEEKCIHHNIDMELSKEKGACEKSHLTNYSKGILPIDTYKRELQFQIVNKNVVHHQQQCLHLFDNSYQNNLELDHSQLSRTHSHR